MPHGTHNAISDPRNENIEIYINGVFYKRNEAKISVFDSAFLVGDGVWEGIRLHHKKFVFLDRHLDRLFAGAKAIGLNIGKTREELAEALHTTVSRNNMTDDVHIRLMISRGIKKTPSQDPRLTIGAPTIVIIAEYKKANPETAKEGVRLFTATVRRPPPGTLDQKLNCHSKLHEVIALVQALNANADEALMLDPTGAVATCNATNFFITKKGEVLTSTGQYCLNGITRGVILDICRENKIPVHEKPFSLTEVYDADEAFVTGTFGGLTPVTEVDGRRIGNGKQGKLTKRLSELYQVAIERDVAGGETI
ncbi:MAG TPA: aminotransferase class IV [Balneolaceae bacterium]